MTTKITFLQDESTSNKLFYNIDLKNDTNDSIPLIFNENLQSFILLEKPNNYEISVARFSIPMYNVPLFTFTPGKEKISMTYSTYSYTTDVPFISRINVPIIDEYYYFVYEVTQYMQMLNQAIQNCCDMLDAQYYGATLTHLSIVTSSILNPSYDPLQPISLSNLEFIQTYNKPYFIYDKDNELISVCADKTYYEDKLTNGYKLYENNNVFSKIQGIDDYLTVIPNMEHIAIFHNNYDNVTGNIIENKQQSFTISTFIDFTSVLFKCNIPTQLEYVGAGGGDSVLAEFVPLEYSIKHFFENLVYAPQVIYKQVQIKTDLQFNSFLISCYRTNVTNEKKQMYLPPRDSASIKIMFQLKRTSKY